MARKRRGSSTRSRPARSTPVDLQKTLGSLLRSTLEQVGAMGEAALERARSSRERVDHVVLERRRRDALARLGEAVYVLALRGNLEDVAGSPEIARLLSDVEEIEDQLVAADAAHDPDRDDREFPEHEREAVSSADWRPAPRARSDDREFRVWRPPSATGKQAHAGQAGAEPEKAHADSNRGRGQSRGRGRRRRPSESGDPAATYAARPRGGIAFVSDEVPDPDADLSAYMHDDDVPLRPDDDDVDDGGRDRD